MSSSKATVGGVLASLLPAVLFSLLFVAAGVVHVTGRVLVVDAGYRLGQAQSEARKLEREHQRLVLERETLRGPQRLERLAREQLGMGPPPAGAIVRLPAAPATAGALARRGTP